MTYLLKLLPFSLIILIILSCSNNRDPSEDTSYYNNISIKSPGNPASALDLKEVKAVLPTLPTGYAEFMKMFGSGFIGNGLYILTPKDMLYNSFLSHSAQRKFRKDYWFWDEYGYKVEFFDTFVPIASSDDGDIYLIDPIFPDTIYRLMHEGGVQITKGGIPGLLKARAEMDKDEIDSYKSWFIFEGFQSDN